MSVKRIMLLLAVISVGIGCSSVQSSTPDYEIASEKDKDISNLKVKTLKVSTDFTREQKLRQIAEDIKDDNTNYDTLSIQFHKGAQGNGSPKQTGTAIVVNNRQAAEKMLPDILFTDARRKELLDEYDGILVISRADIKRFEHEMKEAGQELDKEMKQQSKELKKNMDKADQEMREMQKDLDREMQELEKEMEKEMPKPPQP